MYCSQEKTVISDFLNIQLQFLKSQQNYFYGLGEAECKLV